MSARHRVHWRLALAATGSLWLAACVAPTPRPGAPAPAPAPQAAPPPPPSTGTAAPLAAEEKSEPSTRLATTTVTAAPTDSPWPRLRRRFAMQGCDYRPEVQRLAAYYTRNPRLFARNWRRAMPFVLIVVDELERRDLPGEFAMLPYLESTYEPVASRGDLPAGIWQLLPDSARTMGVPMVADYDGRLDPFLSTGAALDLLERYWREFADWRLTDMAFSTGEFRVRRLLGERDARNLSAAELAALPFTPRTHEHLDRLLALSCVIDDPARFGVTLPEPVEADHLERVELTAPIDVRLAARLAGEDPDEVKRWNAAQRRNRLATVADLHLLLPATSVQRFRAASAAVAPDWWPDWREERANRTSSIDSWARQFGLPVAVLAAANAVEPGATINATTRLLVPGKEPAPTREAPAGARGARTHRVAAGDTLSQIAHRYDVPLGALRKLNPHMGGTLHLGDQVRLSAAGAE